MTGKQGLRLGLQTSQRLALMGRLRMAEWIEMPEREFAREVEQIEKDPLFQKLFVGVAPGTRVIRRQAWPGGSLSGSFYELDEARAAGGERVKVEEKLAGREHLLPLIRKMGQQAFERYFLLGEEDVSLDEIARRTGLGIEDVRAIHDFLLEIGAEAELAGPGRDPEAVRANACLARINLEDGEPSYEFLSPYWARGLYQVRYDMLEQWKKGDLLSGLERKRLRHLLKRIETVNLRQNTLFRILEAVTKLHADYLRTRAEDRKRPISLRMLAHRLDLAPSTVSRALAGRSVRLPWGREVPLIQLVPGRRKVLRDVLSRWLAEGGPHATDAQLMLRLREEYGISVSRRTINAVRHEVQGAPPAER